MGNNLVPNGLSRRYSATLLALLWHFPAGAKGEAGLADRTSQAHGVRELIQQPATNGRQAGSDIAGAWRARADPAAGDEWPAGWVAGADRRLFFFPRLAAVRRCCCRNRKAISV